VIHEVDAVLRSLIRDNALPDVITDVEFDAPTRDWVARRNSPTVNDVGAAADLAVEPFLVRVGARCPPFRWHLRGRRGIDLDGRRPPRPRPAGPGWWRDPGGDPAGSGVVACMLGGDDGRTLHLCAAPSFSECERQLVRAAQAPGG
jgi:hypothetical protein